MTLTPHPFGDEHEAVARGLYIGLRLAAFYQPKDPIQFQADFLGGYVQRLAELRKEQE